MEPRNELEALRRLAELEAKAGGRRQPVDVEAAGEQAAREHWQGLSGLDQFIAGAGKTVADLGRVFDSGEEVRRQRAKDKPLMETTGGMLGNLAGSVAMAAPTAFIPGANTVTGAGLVGGLYGALQPAENAAERVQNIVTGGVGSGAVTGATRALPALKRAFVDPFTGSGRDRIAADVIRRNMTQPLNYQPSLVPGVQRTLAEGTRDVGLAQLERSVMANAPDAARQLGLTRLANDDALVGAVREMAGTERDRALQRGVRDMMSGPLYQQAMTQGIDPAMAQAMAPQVQSLLARPSIQTAINTVRGVFDEQQIAQMQAGSPQGMQLLKQALDDMIEVAGRQESKIGRNQLRALQQTRSDLIQTMEELTPTLRQADEAFRSWSRPVNQMEVAEALANRLEPALTRAGGTGLTPASFARAMDETGDALVRQATGQRAGIADVMAPHQMGRLNAVTDDLGRRQFAQTAGRAVGSPTAQYLAGGNALRAFLGPLGLPQGLADTVLAQTLANRWISLAARPAEQRMQEALARALMDPTEAQRVLSAQPGQLARLLRQGGQYALPPAAVGLVNSAQQ